MTPADITAALASLPAWRCDGRSIAREFRFPDFDATMAFVNAVAAIARRQDHHPDLEVGYARVRVSYTSHDVGGLSARDFAAAAAVDRLPGQ